MNYFDDKEKERQNQIRKHRRIFYISIICVVSIFASNHIYKEYFVPNQVTGFTAIIPESTITVKFNTTKEVFDSQIDSWSLKIDDTRATIIDPEVREYAETCRLFDGNFYYESGNGYVCRDKDGKYITWDEKQFEN